MWEFRKGNVFGATVFTSYGAFWLSFWACACGAGPGISSTRAAASAPMQESVFT